MRHVCASKTLGSNVIINGIDKGDSVETWSFRRFNSYIMLMCPCNLDTPENSLF